MKLNRTGSRWDRSQRININDNWDEIERKYHPLLNLGKEAETTLKKALEVNAEAQNTNNMNKDVQQQINNLILSDGESDAEVIQARGGLPLLKDRLDESDTQLAQTVDLTFQTDLIETINQMKTYDKLYYMRESGNVDLTMIFVRGDEHITWRMKRSASDDYWILGECYAGIIVTEWEPMEDKVYDSLEGSWNTGQESAQFTTEVGAKFTTEITGEKIDFYHYSNDQGGRFKFTLNGDPTTEVIVSTWSETPSTTISMEPKTLYEDLPYGKHTVVGEFIGEDPEHPVTNPRGWIWRIHTNTDFNTLRSYKRGSIDGGVFENRKDKELVIDFSNKELALKMKPLGTEVTPAYTPAHSGIGTTYDREIKEIYVDGKNIIEGSVNDSLIPLPSFKKYECNEISFVQKMRVNIPGYSYDLVNFDTIHTFKKSGNVEIIGKLNVLEDIHVYELFTFMLPVHKSAVDRLTTSKNNYYPVMKTDGSQMSLVPTEGETTSSFAFTSSVDPDYIIAGRINNLVNTLRLGATDKGNRYIWLQHRDETMTKLYTEAMRGSELRAGDVIKFSQTFNCAKINNIHNVL